MPDKQDQKKKDGERKDKKMEHLHEHEHMLHSGEQHSAHPHADDTVAVEVVTQPSGVGHHKTPADAGVVMPHGSHKDERDSRHSHVPHAPDKILKEVEKEEAGRKKHKEK